MIKYYVYLTAKFVVGFSDNKDVADLVAKNGRPIMTLEAENDEDMIDLVTWIQDGVEAALLLLDEQAKAIELSKQINVIAKRSDKN